MKRHGQLHEKAVMSPDRYRIIFIYGVPRSGTTLLRAMLGSHPNVFAAPETPWVIGAYGGIPSLTTVLKSIADSEYGLKANVKTFNESDLEEAVENFTVGLFKSSLTAKNANILVLKTPDDITSLSDIMRFWTKARFVHIKRNPIAVARSTVATGWTELKGFGPNNFRNAIRRWIEWERAAVHVGSSGRVSHVRFENLIKRPIQTLRLLSEYLALPFDSKMLNPYSQPHDLPLWEKGSSSFQSHSALELSRAAVGKTSDEEEAVLFEYREQILALGYRWP